MANNYVAPITLGFTPANGDLIRGTVNGVEVNGKWRRKGEEGSVALKRVDDPDTLICSVGFLDGRTIVGVQSDSDPTDYELHLYRYVPSGIVQIPQEYVEGLEATAADATEAWTAAETAQSTANAAKTAAETAQSTANEAKTTAESIDMLGKTWTQSNVTSNGIYTIGYANGLWVAGSDYIGGGLYYSTDGKTWTQSNRTNGYFGVIVYANGLWVAGSENSAGLYYSTSKYALTDTVDAQLAEVKQSIDEIKSADVILPSSTAGSTKKFKITVDDAGMISAKEVTE